MKLLWTRNHVNGSLKSPVYSGDAGFDVVVVTSVEIPPRGIATLDCGINIALPHGVVAIPMSRSSSVTNGLMVMPTLIDTGYRGPLFLFCVNLTDKVLEVSSGTRVGQLVLFPNVALSIELQQADSLPESERGNNGFGSSGDVLGGDAWCEE